MPVLGSNTALAQASGGRVDQTDSEATLPQAFLLALEGKGCFAGTAGPI